MGSWWWLGERGKSGRGSSDQVGVAMGEVRWDQLEGGFRRRGRRPRPCTRRELRAPRARIGKLEAEHGDAAGLAEGREGAGSHLPGHEGGEGLLLGRGRGFGVVVEKE